MTDKIQMVHGSGGRATGELIHELFAKEFQSGILSQMEDSAVLPVPEGAKIAFTTDSFVVTPPEFPGGDIGRLAVCGTVNDLLARGALPQFLTCGAILEEGLDIPLLKRIVHSMAETAREAGIEFVAGDTKVVENKGGGAEVYFNTSGIGFLSESTDISAKNAQMGDAILVSGTLGDHHAAILGKRLGIENTIRSDCAPLVDMVRNLMHGGVRIHVLRDVTRGGLGTVLKELADASGCVFELEEENLPVTPEVRDFCGLLGLDPLYMGNEGKMAAIVDGRDAEKALEILRTSRYGQNAALIGRVTEKSGSDSGTVILRTPIGGERLLDVLEGEGLPRIC